MLSVSLMKLSSAQSNWRKQLPAGFVDPIPEEAWVKGGKAWGQDLSTGLGEQDGNASAKWGELVAVMSR